MSVFVGKIEELKEIYKWIRDFLKRNARDIGDISLPRTP